MSDIKMSVCGSCGFKWPTGQHGEHSCSSYLVTENASLKARIDELVFSLDDRDCYIADADMKNSGLQARIAELESLIKEADDYLNTNKLTTICNGSILHAAFKEAIKDEKGS